MDKLVRENERLRQQVADYREQMKVFSFVKEGKE
jgi:hypothetical protein